MATQSDIKKLCREYNIKPSQIANYRISNPGKFEGESLATVYFYNGMLDGWTDDSDCIALDENDHIFFGIDAQYKYAHVYDDSNGFAYCEFLTEDEYYSIAFSDDSDDEDSDELEIQQ